MSRPQTADEQLAAAQTARADAARELAEAEASVADIRRGAEAGDTSVIPLMGPAASRLEFARLADTGTVKALAAAEERHVWAVDRQMLADVLAAHGTDAEHDARMRDLIDAAVAPLSALLVAVHARNEAISRLHSRLESSRQRFGLEEHPDAPMAARPRSRELEAAGACRWPRPSRCWALAWTLGAGGVCSTSSVSAPGTRARGSVPRSASHGPKSRARRPGCRAGVDAASPRARADRQVGRLAS